MSACMQTVYFSYFFVDRQTFARPLCVAWALVLNDANKGWGTTVRCNAPRDFRFLARLFKSKVIQTLFRQFRVAQSMFLKITRRKLQRILLCKDIFDESKGEIASEL